MPYISAADRDYLRPESENPAGPGGLNFQLTCIIKQYLDHTGLSYGTINDIVGALENAKLEFYRRVASKYEEEAITRNGDVYPPRLSPPNREIYDGVYGK